MANTQKTESVSVTYKDGRITLTGKTISVSLAISNSELQRVYWYGTGKGVMSVTETPATKGKS